MPKPMLCAFFIAFCLAEGSGSSFRFNATQSQTFAKFKGLTLRRPGTAQLQFCFKTISPSVILLYQDDGRDSFIFIELKEGKIDIEVRSYKYCETSKTKKAEQTVLNDSLWHRVHIEIDTGKPRITLTVDGYMAATVRSSTKKDKACRGLKLTRKTNNPSNGKEPYLYLAGAEIFDDPAKGSIKYIAAKRTFNGCIADLKYTKSNALKLERVKVVSVRGSSGNCSIACTSNYTNECDQGHGCEHEGLNGIEPRANSSDNATNTSYTNSREPSTESHYSLPGSDTNENIRNSPKDRWDLKRSHSAAPESLAAPFSSRATTVATLINVFVVKLLW